MPSAIPGRSVTKRSRPNFNPAAGTRVKPGSSVSTPQFPVTPYNTRYQRSLQVIGRGGKPASTNLNLLTIRDQISGRR